jgi:hypothetical protein
MTVMHVAGAPSSPQEFLQFQELKRIFSVTNRIKFLVEQQKRIEKELAEYLKK